MALDTNRLLSNIAAFDKWLLICWLIFAPAGILWADTAGDPFFLSADGVSYAQDNSQLDASGNVSLKYKNYTINTKFFRFLRSDNQQKEIQFLDSFDLQRDGVSVQAQSATYNLTTFRGGATQLHANLGKIVVFGDRVDLLSDHLEIQNVSFTSCNKPTPDYLIKAEKLMIYPQVGLFIADKNTLFINQVPVFYFPTYFFASREYSLLGKNSPLPEIGSNTQEGWFLKGKISYFVSPQLPGSIDYGYIEKFKWLIGIEQGIKISPYHDLYVKLQRLDGFGYQGGIYYSFDVANQFINTRRDSILEELLTPFLADQNPLVSRLFVQYSVHELEKKYFIDSLPLVKMQLNTPPLLFDFKVLSDANWGRIGEYQPDQSIITTQRFNFNSAVIRKWDLKPFQLDTDFYYRGFFYDTGATWQRFFSKTSLTWDVLPFKPSIFFTKMVSILGTSKLASDADDVELTDELGYRFSYRLNPVSEVQLENAYYLNTRTARMLDLSVKFGFHCWSVVMKRRFVQNEWLFSVELL